MQYIKSGAAIKINSANDFQKALNRFRNKDAKIKQMNKIKEYVSKMHYKNDGQASERVVALIEKLLNTN
ncbi:hypothetical protein KY318_00550, partial [Candidatus Woesearchaeota archaeon]|nr:hypothetical protein [Candidatus Woesearchaeota archaeon]